MPSVPIISFLVPETVDSGETFAITATIQNREDRPLQAKLELVNQTTGETLADKTWILDALETKSLSATTSITAETTFIARSLVKYMGIWVPSDYKTKTVAVTVPPPPPEEAIPPTSPTPPPKEEKVYIYSFTANPSTVEPNQLFRLEAIVASTHISLTPAMLLIEDADTNEDLWSKTDNLYKYEYLVIRKRLRIPETKTYRATSYEQKEGVWTKTDEKTVTVTVTPVGPPPPEEEELPPTSSECPDFWSDPVGAVTCWIISSLEQTLNLMTGGFYSLLNTVKDFVNNLLPTIKDFFSDPMGHVRDYVENTWTWIQDITGTITTVIGDWWNDISKTVQNWINDAIADIKDFIQDPIGYLNNWLNTVKTTIEGWINSAIQGILDFIENFSAHVWEWWNSNISPIFETIRAAIGNIQDFIENPIKFLNDWLNTVKTTIEGWINAILEGALDWVTNKFIDFIYWLSTIPGSIPEYISEQILGVKEFVESYFVENVVNMFGWIDDIKDAIGNAINFFIDIYKMITGEKETPGFSTEMIQQHVQMKEEIESILEE